ncbi:MAG: iron-sulfur cluster repair di-iron protein [Bacteroidales bacterium]|jgi:regulator of cell morphogenesis and NO signaling|nr:iron-sulfur cluster repair di-iron protein [Bacteroidales bacterium]
MKISGNTSVGEVVRFNLKTALLLNEYNIDYCCGGSKTIFEACSEAGIDADTLIIKLEKLSENNDPDTEYINSLVPDELSDYIERRHHSYVKNHIPFLRQSLDKICDVHGSRHPELLEIRELFRGSAADLTTHMQKEEIILFPYIRKMVRVSKDGSQVGRPDFGSVSNPVSMMLAEHENEGRRFDRISELSQNFSIPEDACTTYRATLDQLKEFRDDLHRHIHLENNILFPEAIRLEKELTGKLL